MLSTSIASSAVPENANHMVATQGSFLDVKYRFPSEPFDFFLIKDRFEQELQTRNLLRFLTTQIPDIEVPDGGTIQSRLQIEDYSNRRRTDRALAWKIFLNCAHNQSSYYKAYIPTTANSAGDLPAAYQAVIESYFQKTTQSLIALPHIFT